MFVVALGFRALVGLQSLGLGCLWLRARGVGALRRRLAELRGRTFVAACAAFDGLGAGLRSLGLWRLWLPARRWSEFRILVFAVEGAALERLSVGLRWLGVGCLWLRTRGFGAFGCWLAEFMVGVLVAARVAFGRLFIGLRSLG